MKHEGGTCHVIAQITPKHRISSPPYQIDAVIDEKEEKVKEVYCADCAGSAGKY